MNYCSFCTALLFFIYGWFLVHTFFPLILSTAPRAHPHTGTLPLSYKHSHLKFTESHWVLRVRLEFATLSISFEDFHLCVRVFYCVCICVLSLSHICAGALESQEKILDPQSCSYRLLPAAQGGCWGSNSGPLEELQELLTANQPLGYLSSPPMNYFTTLKQTGLGFRCCL